jgi:hypothetical protein
MPFSAGDKLGPYEVLSLLAKGGMGEGVEGARHEAGSDCRDQGIDGYFSESFERAAKTIARTKSPAHLHACSTLARTTW